MASVTHAGVGTSIQTAELGDGQVTAVKLAADAATQAELDAHAADTTSVHGITDTANVMVAGASYSSRALTNNTEYTPSATRPTLVIIAPRIQLDTAEEGAVAIQVGTAGAPAEIARCGLDNDNLAISSAVIPAAFIVPAGKVYKLVNTTVAGTPAFTLGNAQELTL